MTNEKPTQSETEPLSPTPLEVDTNTAAGSNHHHVNVHNPYTSRDVEALHISGSSRIVRKVKSIFFLCLSLYFLHYEELYHTILHSPHIQHTWFSLGLAFTLCK